MWREGGRTSLPLEVYASAYYRPAAIGYICLSMIPASVEQPGEWSSHEPLRVTWNGLHWEAGF